ncbi:PREDICTED: tumor necrosis factor receptor superfamily member 6 [Condylura cristata]|uniref:tumor necrosis factor receptor superfamily member 6 n=1 Tax=Condylura cristata TaxID=143302 RepID=UPI000643DF8E|nr:PREDICTED: tumor necrosis factor receptor superfamily member 6 [Condylura cristata]
MSTIPHMADVATLLKGILEDEWLLPDPLPVTPQQWDDTIFDLWLQENWLVIKSDLSLMQILTAIVGSLYRGANAQVTDTISEAELLKLRKNITKREIKCSGGLHRGGLFCCQPCEKGERKVADCTVSKGKPTCEPCPEGKEYTEVDHYSTKCRRCSICDAEHGFEVEKNCTRIQNTKCRCKANFFCENSACEHCNPCIMCEHGIIENCTSTSNTKCKEGSRSNLLWLLVLVPIATLISFAYSYLLPTKLSPESDRIVFDLSGIYRRYRDKKKGHHEFKAPNSETLLNDFTDIDLSKYITSIAELMTVNQVKEFVRKNGVSETKIDEIKNDHVHDSAEQKVQLLRNWYQIHGKKEAYETLIKSFQKAKLCSLVDKIHDLILKENANLNHDRQNLV